MEAGVLSLNAPSLTCGDLKGFVDGRISAVGVDVSDEQWRTDTRCECVGKFDDTSHAFLVS